MYNQPLLRRIFLITGFSILALGVSVGLSYSAQKKPPQKLNLPPPPVQFNQGYIDDLARSLANQPYNEEAGIVPEQLRDLNAAQYGAIKFKPERAFFSEGKSPYRLQLHHAGYLYQRSVTVNLITNGTAYAAPYSPELFDAGENKLETLPADLGYAGFRIHTPLNTPNIFDELVSFQGAASFKLLARNQRYGQNARALAIDTGLPSGEEFPFFRQFWVETPQENAKFIVMHALLDSPSVTGAYHFILQPGKASVLDVRATLFFRKSVKKLGLSPLAAMFFYGEGQERKRNDFRPEIHDADSLLIHNGAGEWLLRPLNNPERLNMSSFVDNNPRGFGLLQRDRVFDHYQDLNMRSETKPSSWVEPIGAWGEGSVELIEIPSPDDTNDNIVAMWVPKKQFKAGESLSFSYKLAALEDVEDKEYTAKAKVQASFSKRLKAEEIKAETSSPVRRFYIDFSGGDLEFHASQKQKLELAVTSSAGKIISTDVVVNPSIKGFRASFDLSLEAGQTTDLRANLMLNNSSLSEVWTRSWREEE